MENRIVLFMALVWMGILYTVRTTTEVWYLNLAGKRETTVQPPQLVVHLVQEVAY